MPPVVVKRQKTPQEIREEQEKRLKQLEEENANLRLAVAELTMLLALRP